MVLFSIAIHLAGFSMILFVPEPSPTHAIRDSVYEVSLVEAPSKPGPPSAPSKKKVTKVPKEETPEKEPIPTKRIAKVERKEKAISTAKKTIKPKNKKAEKSDISRSKLLEKALSDIKKKEPKDKEKTGKTKKKKLRAPDKKDELEETISRIASRVKERSEGESGREGPRTGLIMRLYKLEIESHVRSHWSYPSLLAPEAGESPKAVVVLKVKNDGTILNFRFKERSSNEIFDQSVLKAVKQSDPIPPFPEGYRKTKDEIVITFDLEELAQ